MWYFCKYSREGLCCDRGVDLPLCDGESSSHARLLPLPCKFIVSTDPILDSSSSARSSVHCFSSCINLKEFHRSFISPEEAHFFLMIIGGGEGRGNMPDFVVDCIKLFLEHESESLGIGVSGW